MAEKTKVGILLCNHHCGTCHGIKCFRAFNNKEGAFEAYKNKELELISYATCTGCPGGGVANKVLDDWKKAGIEVAFLSSGWVCGYPPCPHLKYMRKLIEDFYGMKVVVGTHPIPTTFWERHKVLGSWDSEEWQEAIRAIVTDEKTRQSYI